MSGDREVKAAEDTKRGISADLQAVLERVDRLQKGKVPFVDIHMGHCSRATKHLREAIGHLNAAIRPSST